MSVRDKLISSVTSSHQRSFILFGVIAGKSNTIIHQELTQYLGDKALSKSQVAKYASEFRAGEVKDERGHGGSSKDSDLLERRITQIKELFEETRHWSLRSLSAATDIPRSSLNVIIREHLKMKKILSKWVPHVLSPEQMQLRVLMSQMNLRHWQKTPTLLKRTLTIDETWVSLYMQPDRNQARSYQYPGEHPEPVPVQSIHANKRMLIMAMDWKGIAFYSLLPPKTTVDGNVYREFLEQHIPDWLGQRSSRYLWLLHDNARPHKSQPVRAYLAEQGITLWEHPPYSPDISPLDFNCFGPLKRLLRGTRHEDWESFESNLEAAVSKLNEEGRMQGVMALPDRWRRLIAAEGSYISN